MAKKSILPLTPHHIFIYNEDWDFLSERYSTRGPRPAGVSAACREIIHQKVLELKEKLNQKSPKGDK